MRYIRTKDGIYEAIINTFEHSWGEISWSIGKENHVACNKEEYEKQIRELKTADTIEELIQIGDIVFYWAPSDDKEHCLVLNYDTELHSIKYNAITRLLIPVGEDYKCVAKGFPSFNLIKGRRYLVNKQSGPRWQNY